MTINLYKKTPGDEFHWAHVFYNGGSHFAYAKRVNGSAVKLFNVPERLYLNTPPDLRAELTEMILAALRSAYKKGFKTGYAQARRDADETLLAALDGVTEGEPLTFAEERNLLSQAIEDYESREPEIL